MNRKSDIKNDFEAFVKRQQQRASEAKQVDWLNEREQWLGYLNKLYETIESFLAPYTENGRITHRYREIELNEENIGTYKARQMILKIGGQEIVLTPVGTLLIGSKGRVDVIGPAGRTRLILVDREASAPTIKVSVHIGGKPQAAPKEPPHKKINWAWKIVTTPPAVRFLELTQESFFRALMEIANG